jgi:hypothetical protein
MIIKTKLLRRDKSKSKNALQRLLPATKKIWATLIMDNNHITMSFGIRNTHTHFTCEKLRSKPWTRALNSLWALLFSRSGASLCSPSSTDSFTNCTTSWTFPSNFDGCGQNGRTTLYSYSDTTVSLQTSSNFHSLGAFNSPHTEELHCKKLSQSEASYFFFPFVVVFVCIFSVFAVVASFIVFCLLCFCLNVCLIHVMYVTCLLCPTVVLLPRG